MNKDGVRLGQAGTVQWRGLPGRVAGVLLLSLILGSMVFLWPVAAGPADGPREIKLVTRNMAFYLEGSDVRNPVLTMRAGEALRVVLRNEDIGITHSFEVGTWDQAVLSAKGGLTEAAVIEIPNHPGQYEYVCGPHPALMRGVVEVIKAD